MRIVYDQTKTREKGLAGWSDSMPSFSGNADISSADQALWELLAPDQMPNICSLSVSRPSLQFWDQLFIVRQADRSQYDILRENPFDSPSNNASIALSGRGFHGQRSRPWSAHEGNLHLSISVPLDLPTGPESLAWTMLPAVAVMKALGKMGIPAHERCGIKWINDVLVGGEKLAGSISSLVVSGGRVRRGFLGIGLNVSLAPDLPVATCCLHQHLDREGAQLGMVLREILSCIADLILLLNNGGNDAIIAEYQRLSLVVGRQVQIMSDPAKGSPEEICRGTVQEILPDLGLMLEGQDEPVHRGRLFFLE